ncbi:MAG: sigma-70 family RNA polymerase sigma factor [Ruminococcaceae bacterium]|nr:sigma-70 family RNA polymerase sigma factor [Oscillospiraceae bacterium]
MEDHDIVTLYWDRSEAAIRETEQKYGKYCYTIAYNILYSHEDAEECVNDTYVKAWDTMPPERPTRLSAYLGTITRNIALNRYAHDRAQKRNIHLTEVYDEAADAFPMPEKDLSDELMLKEVINGFVASLEKETRIIFVRRYWYFSSVKDIAKDYKIPEGTVKSILSRTRKRFKEHLEKEGIHL